VKGYKELEIAVREQRPVGLIYLSREGELSQRVVRVREVSENGVKAFCLKKREPRTFLMEGILAVSLDVRGQRRHG
jgi:predicted DNA-binding transcriptional regulator YafY